MQCVAYTEAEEGGAQELLLGNESDLSKEHHEVEQGGYTRCQVGVVEEHTHQETGGRGERLINIVQVHVPLYVYMYYINISVHRESNTFPPTCS